MPIYFRVALGESTTHLEASVSRALGGFQQTDMNLCGTLVGAMPIEPS